MSQPTGPTAMPGGHPDPDLLADLVAAVLPPEQALGVEQHVVGCAQCAALLGDAEGVRRLLLEDPVGPIPADVAARLDAALQREALWASAQTVEGPAVAAAANGHAGAEPPAQAQPRSRRERARLDRERGEDPPTGTLPKESFFDEPYPTAMIPAGSIPVSSPSGPSVSRLRRADRGGTQRTRRQVRSEERSDRVPAWLTGKPVLAVAASLVAVLVLGTAVQQFTGGADTAATSAGGAAADSAGGAAPESAVPPVPVLATGTDYTSAKLNAQAKALISKATAFQAAEQRSALAASGAGSEGGAAGVGGGSVTGNSAPTPSSAASVTPPAANELLRDPAALDACLAAIDSQGVRPVAVDLATYQGREAAILVLPAAAGGYEVWAVSRTCKPGADGTLIFKPVS